MQMLRFAQHDSPFFHSFGAKGRNLAPQTNDMRDSRFAPARIGAACDNCRVRWVRTCGVLQYAQSVTVIPACARCDGRFPPGSQNSRRERGLPRSPARGEAPSTSGRGNEKAAEPSPGIRPARGPSPERGSADLVLKVCGSSRRSQRSEGPQKRRC